jgi:hypothetical protein
MPHQEFAQGHCDFRGPPVVVGCVDVLFAWAPRFVDHVEMTQVCVCPTRNLLKGTVTLGDPQ